MIITAAGQAPKGILAGMIAVIIVAVIIIAIMMLKKAEGSADEAAVKERGKPAGKQQRIQQTRQQVDDVCMRLEKLVRRADNLKRDIRDTAHAAVDRVLADGKNSAYSQEEIKAIASVADDLESDISYGNVKEMAEVLHTVSSHLLLLLANQRVPVEKGAPDIKDARTYVDPGVWANHLSVIEADETGLTGLLEEMQAALDTLRIIAYRNDSAFTSDITIIAEANGDFYTGIWAAKDKYGVSQPGAFQLDSVQLLSKQGHWVTLPDIMKQKSGIRIFALDERRIRAIADRTILGAGAEKQRLVEFDYGKPIVLVKGTVTITLQFE